MKENEIDEMKLLRETIDYWCERNGYTVKDLAIGCNVGYKYLKKILNDPAASFRQSRIDKLTQYMFDNDRE